MNGAATPSSDDGGEVLFCGGTDWALVRLCLLHLQHLQAEQLFKQAALSTIALRLAIKRMFGASFQTVVLMVFDRTGTAWKGRIFQEEN